MANRRQTGKLALGITYIPNCVGIFAKNWYHWGMPVDTKERRRSFRHLIHTPLQLEVDHSKNGPRSVCADISLGGLSFLWKSRIPKNSHTTIGVAVKNKVFYLKTRVVYCRGDQKTGKFRVGVAFADSPSAFKAKLAEEVLEILEYQKELSRKLGYAISEEESAERWIKEYAANFPANP